ncbi:protein of unknown function [Taphrina deformans PYCC 5710]|uniref:tRNA N(3)-methylcytidine methyltransferase n=1 Tax=Taphrina deformans (strain PYCC 5710 / ATCC 11124 / CBS 356.35 / IMI 108563 / JCM 9778 / NBRC 8474) TaxID=1097556 RepID=R4XF73_TAPDE|nr:protein of unknown function [Taphrina deformans PYCC 5710]|eukprot:CCG84303.1 protein of unknown function [Taphrina deformans PYCC 5710]
MKDSIQSLLDISGAGPEKESTPPDSVALKACSSAMDTTNRIEENTTFGSRLLTDPSKVDDFNAWDHVEWDDAHLSEAATKVAFQSANPVPEEDRARYGDEFANEHWNKFYEHHEEGFFKDRKWIKLEFPELIACTKGDAGPKVIADLGCAVGNTVYPLLRVNENAQLRIHALDFSSEAIRIVRQAEEFTDATINAAVWDMGDANGPHKSIPDSSVDVIVLIFAFSALSPAQWPLAMENFRRMLKPGGLILLRDYGRYDLTQLRLKANRLLDDSFYIRGDGTRVYYFTNEELAALFKAEDGWTLEQNAIDKRLLVNRKENKKMYRAWVQIKARKT